MGNGPHYIGMFTNIMGMIYLEVNLGLYLSKRDDNFATMSQNKGLSEAFFLIKLN
jgi:hypothetical protein